MESGLLYAVAALSGRVQQDAKKECNGATMAMHIMAKGEQKNERERSGDVI